MDATSANILIGCISAFATVVAAVIYYWTLKELRKQRANTYRPHLFIDNANFRVIKPANDNYGFPSYWIDTTKGEAFEGENAASLSHGPLFPFYLKCYNIGFGTAKRIKVSFDYDINSFVDELKSMEVAIPEELKVEFARKGNFISIGYLPSPIRSGEALLRVDAFLESYISYILPIQISTIPTNIPLPRHFLGLINIYVHYFVSLPRDGKGVQVREFNVPPVRATIEYMDNANQSFSSKVLIQSNIAMFSNKEYFGRFEVHEE